MKTRLLTIFLFLSISYIGWAQQLFGHINSQEIISIMPEAATAQLALQQELGDLQEQGKIMAEEYESQLKDFQINQETMSEAIRNDKLKSLQDLEERITLFQQSAQQSIQLKEAELFEPILTKIQNAIDEVAKDKGYAYVFDIGGNAGGLVYKNDSFDITSMVKSKLNL
ncbi:OmpH family outer membrane protein [Flavobacteriales bacterium]|nr:OmpH family outer membrane protein [Flavobacteriales bacterium]